MPAIRELACDSGADGAPVRYPFETVPLPGEAIEVATGVFWLRMPLPMSGLNHTNVWALEDDDGWTLCDTGMQTAETAAAWRSACARVLQGRRVLRVICTHMHPDHVGMAGWLTRHHECRLWMTRLEYLTCRMLVGRYRSEAPVDGVRFYRAAGWDAEALESYRRRFGAFGQAVYALPDSYRRIVDDEQLRIGGRSWRDVVGRGHSPEHLCLFCPELKLLISGDQVLPRITSNVSVFPTEPDADPLSEWLESLVNIRERVSEEVLVLPSHNEPFQGLHARLDALIALHEMRLRQVREESPSRSARSTYSASCSGAASGSIC